jgi:hypothetical protein
MSEPIIIQYANILHAYGVGSDASEAFKKKHADKPDFQRRATKLDELKLKATMIISDCEGCGNENPLERN